MWAREDGLRALAGIGGDEGEEGAEERETMRESEGACHPLVGGVVVREGVKGGSPREEMEVEVGEGRVVVEFGFEEVG